METIALTKFKATCHAVIARVQVSGNPVLVTKRGKPLIVVSPVPKQPKTKFRCGMYRDQIKIPGDIVSPVDLEVWQIGDGPI